MQNDKFRSKLANARGLGSAHEGFEHWWWQRLTAIALVPLVVWFVVSFISLGRLEYAEAALWFKSPFNAILSALLFAAMFYHAYLGTRVIVEDYVSCKVAKISGIIALKAFFAVSAVASILAVIKLNLGV